MPSIKNIFIYLFIKHDIYYTYKYTIIKSY